MPTDDITTIPNTFKARQSISSVPERGDDWRVWGAEFVPDWDGDLLYLTKGGLAITDSGTLYWVVIQARDTDRDALSIPAGQSTVYYDVDASAGTGQVVVGGSPSQPYLELGTLDAGAETYDDTANDTADDTLGALNAEKGHIAGGGTFVVYERNGTYYASGVNGGPEFSNTTPDLAALIQSIADDINPSGISTDGDSVSLHIKIEPQDDAYTWASQLSVEDGTRFAVTSAGTQSFILNVTGPTDSPILSYEGNNQITDIEIGYRYSTVTLSDFVVLWSDDRTADILSISNACTLRVANVHGWDTRGDVSDRIKENESTNIVPSGDWFFLNDGGNNVSEHRHYENIWVAFASRCLRSASDHVRGDSIQAFWCNPPSSSDGVFEFANGGPNDHTWTNIHAYESGGSFIELSGTSNENHHIHNPCGEGGTPTGYTSQGTYLLNSAGAKVQMFGADRGSDQSYTLWDGDLSKTLVFAQGLGPGILDIETLPEVAAREESTAVSVPAGGSTEISTGVGIEIWRLDEVVWDSNGGSADFGLDTQLWWDESVPEWKIRVTETEGARSVDVYWRLMRYKDSL
jgi:hypothetical protein